MESVTENDSMKCVCSLGCFRDQSSREPEVCDSTEREATVSCSAEKELSGPREPSSTLLHISSSQTRLLFWTTMIKPGASCFRMNEERRLAAFTHIPFQLFIWLLLRHTCPAEPALPWFTAKHRTMETVIRGPQRPRPFQREPTILISDKRTE